MGQSTARAQRRQLQRANTRVVTVYGKWHWVDRLLTKLKWNRLRYNLLKGRVHSMELLVVPGKKPVELSVSHYPVLRVEFLVMAKRKTEA